MTAEEFDERFQAARATEVQWAAEEREHAERYIAWSDKFSLPERLGLLARFPDSYSPYFIRELCLEASAALQAERRIVKKAERLFKRFAAAGHALPPRGW